MTHVSSSELHRIFNYNIDDGCLVWKPRPDRSKEWNTRYAGQPAGCFTKRQGYMHVTINGKGIRTHKVVWAWCHGDWPSGHIDHINGIKTDNRIENLRLVSNQENHRNMPMQRNNTSGVTGVNWCSRLSKWRAGIRAEGKNLHLVVFPNKDDAVDARREAERKYGFHPNHGRTISINEGLAK